MICQADAKITSFGEGERLSWAGSLVGQAKMIGIPPNSGPVLRRESTPQVGPKRTGRISTAQRVMWEKPDGSAGSNCVRW